MTEEQATRFLKMQQMILRRVSVVESILFTIAALSVAGILIFVIALAFA